MAINVTAQVIGGSPKIIEASTVAEAKQKLQALGVDLSGNYTATVNGEPADDSQSLGDYEFVAFARAVKGAWVRAHIYNGKLYIIC